MTTLEQLQAEAREVANHIWNNGNGLTHNDIDRLLDPLVERVFTAALQEALGKVPGEMNLRADDFAAKGTYFHQAMSHNNCRTETIQGIISLFPKKDI